MSGTKKTFSTPKNVIITIGCMIVVFAVTVIGTVCVMNAMQEKSSIGADNGGSANVGGNNEGVDNSGSGAADTNTYIGIDQAKANALADAGVTAAEVTYTKAEFDYEDGVPVYDIEFYTSEKEYEYEIHAQTGSVYSRDVDVLPVGIGAGNGGGSNEGVGNNGNADVGGSNAGADNSGNTSAGGSNTGVGNSGNGAADIDAYIGIDQAKELATEHAGFSVSDVVFSKAELDYDDGLAVYEIEFYKGRAEYEYEINAVTGDILEYDWD